MADEMAPEDRVARMPGTARRSNSNVTVKTSVMRVKLARMEKPGLTARYIEIITGAPSVRTRKRGTCSATSAFHESRRDLSPQEKNSAGSNSLDGLRMSPENASPALCSAAWILPATSANRTMALRFGYATQTA